MRTSTVIKERLNENAARLQAIQEQNSPLSRVQQIEVEYLQMESQTFETILTNTKTSWWRRLIMNKQVRFLMALLTMSFYVVGISSIFNQMDLSRVEQWEFAVTALPFWLILALVPLAFLTLIVSKDSRN